MCDFQYICFDLDGTLVRSGDGIKSALLSVFAEYHLDAAQIGDLDKFIGPPLKDSFMRYCGFGEDEVDSVIDTYRKYYLADGQYNAALYDGVPALLSDLCDAGKNVILVTSKQQAVAADILQRFAIKKYFAHIVGANPDNTMTDKSQLLASVIKRFDIQDKTKAVMIGDREYDAIGAAANGIACIGVLYGYGSFEELKQANASYFAESIEDLRLLLQIKRQDNKN